MEKESAQERKRAARAVPAARIPVLPGGCLLVLVGYAGALGYLWWETGSTVYSILVCPAILIAAALIVRTLRRRALLLEVMWKWRPRGIRCLVIHSNSRLWEEHIARRWLPRLGPMAETLDWSQRASWEGGLSVRVFHTFCMEIEEDFNPAVVVFQGLRDPLVFRFHQAFKEAKKGRSQYLERLEADLFRTLGIEPTG